MDPITYAAAGVDIKGAESFVERLKRQSTREGHKQLWKAAGGYACVYPTSENQGVALTTDGVGTKLLVAEQLRRYDTIGIDLVAMCANDLICVGARPTVFLDYFAVGKLEPYADDIIKGIVAGCDQAEMILAGGETAEMPGVYAPGRFDLAGFAVGMVAKDKLITGEEIRPGQKVIGVASSGIHSNGFSLARKVLASRPDLSEALLRPTLIYARPVNLLMDMCPTAIKGIVHITGGGWRNVLRLSDNVGYQIEDPLPVPAILQEIGKTVLEKEMYSTFNMGMGLCLIVDDAVDTIIDVFNSTGFTAKLVGVVSAQANCLNLVNSSVSFKE
jgi:phosphoribosylformylglycinamidine cyclo-ligase